MNDKHNCIDCARAKIEYSSILRLSMDQSRNSSIDAKIVTCMIALPFFVERPDIFITDGRCISQKSFMDGGVEVENCPAWYTNTPPQLTLPDWKNEGEYAVLSGVTHNGKRWECFKENGGKYGDAVEPGTDSNVWRDVK